MIKVFFIFTLLTSQLFFKAYGIQLYSTVNEVDFNLPRVELSEGEKVWLKNRVVRVGFVKNDFPPYDISNDGSSLYYEGITADYLKLFELVLGTKTQLIPFKTRKEAIAAIKNDKVDILTSSNDYESILGLTLTEPYQNDIPAVFIDSYNNIDNIKKIGIFYEYLPDQVIFDRYPNSELVRFSSPEKLVSSLIDGNVDAIVLDLFSANYQINSEFVDNISFKELLDFDSKGFSFAINKNNKVLLELLNRVLLSIDNNLKMLLKRNWNGGGTSVPTKSAIESARYMAKKYVKDAQEIKVVLAKYSAPISYIGKNESPQGILIEWLDLMRLYTGVKFTYIFKNTLEERIEAIKSGEGDISAFSRSNDRDFYFTKSFTTSPYVLIAKLNKKSTDVSKIYLPEGHLLTDDIKLANKNIKIVSSNSYIDALNDVVNSDSDTLTVAPLLLANYYINHFFKDDLYIKEIITDIPAATLNLAMLNNNQNLANLFSEFIDYIPAQDVKIITNRWQKNALPTHQNWKDYQYTVYTLIFSGVIIILVLLASSSVVILNYKKRLLFKEKLLEQLNFIQILIDSIPHPIYAINSKLEYILKNKCYLEFEKSPNFSSSDVQSYEDISYEEFIQDIDLDNKKALKDNVAIFKDRAAVIDNKKYDFYHWIQPFSLKNDNSVNGIICGWIDVSDRVSLLEQLSESKELADSANVAKSRFLATMSHEIRTPINAILGLLELVIKKHGNNEFDIQSVDIAHQAASDLLDLIGDILDISKIESGKLSISPKRNNLKSTIHSIYKIYSQLAIQKGINFYLYFDDNIKEDLLYDEARMKQVLVNIVSNAIKFTDNGSINLRVLLLEKNNDNCQIKVTLEDEGIGIPEVDIASIFQAFNQANNHSGKGGTGLGLMISKSICDLMGASFDIESLENIGTKISIILNFELYKDNEDFNTQNVICIEDYENKAYKVLIVDDYAPNRLLLSEQLKYLNHHVTQSSNGEEALEIFISEKFDLIITDCNMPKMDGYELAKRIRYHEKEQDIPPIYIIGYTANAQKEAFDKCLKSGMNSCLFKPINIEDLSNEISHTFAKEKVVESASLTQEQWFNIEMVNSLTAGNPELNKQILEQILSANVCDVRELKTALNEKDYVKCKSIAHRMKSGANIIGCSQVLKLCDYIENMPPLEQEESHIHNLISFTLEFNKRIEMEIK